ncbi:hypothetical protein [Caballeronia humi]|uniref:hypothetical protein n=1 Tax=Caballeronia humi TaxID=326474 RepID=UPI001F381C2B|nr:hypothetical protein [Caballeronia humi]
MAIHDCDDRINRAPAAQAAYLIHPRVVDLMILLLRVEHDDAVRDRVAAFDETWCEAHDDVIIAGDDDPAIAESPAPAVALAQCVV